LISTVPINQDGNHVLKMQLKALAGTSLVENAIFVTELIRP
jgi:hypothetical protein